jgi:hypothetical protein
VTITDDSGKTLFDSGTDQEFSQATTTRKSKKQPA